MLDKEELLQVLKVMSQTFEHLKQYLRDMENSLHKEKNLAMAKVSLDERVLEKIEERLLKYQYLFHFFQHTDENFKIIEKYLLSMKEDLLDESNANLRHDFSAIINSTIESISKLIEEDHAIIFSTERQLYDEIEQTFINLLNLRNIIDFKSNVDTHFKPPRESLTRKELQAETIGRFCFRGDTRHPDFIFKTGFINIKKTKNKRQKKSDIIISRPFESTRHVVALSTNLYSAAFFPLAVPDPKNPKKGIFPQNIWIYVVKVEKGFNVAGHGYLALADKLNQDRFNMFPQEIITDEIPPENIIGAIKVKRLPISKKDFMDLFEKKKQEGYDLRDLPTWYVEQYILGPQFEIHGLVLNPKCTLPDDEVIPITQSIRAALVQKPSGIIPFATDAFVHNDPAIVKMLAAEKKCGLAQGTLMQITDTTLRNHVIQNIDVIISSFLARNIPLTEIVNMTSSDLVSITSGGLGDHVSQKGEHQPSSLFSIPLELQKLQEIYQLIDKIKEIEVKTETNELLVQAKLDEVNMATHQHDSKPSEQKRSSSLFFGSSTSSVPSQATIKYAPIVEQILAEFAAETADLDKDEYQQNLKLKLAEIRMNFAAELGNYTQLAESYLDVIKKLKESSADTSEYENLFKKAHKNIAVLSSLITEFDTMIKPQGDIKTQKKM